METIDSHAPVNIPAGVGFTYREKRTSLIWTMEGFRMHERVVLSRAGTVGKEIRDAVSIQSLADDYDFLSCDHDAACCDLHTTHVNPHTGCLLR